MVCVTFVYRYNQINAISMACKTGVKGCLELTRMWYRQWMKDPDSNLYGNHFPKPEIWIQFIPVPISFPISYYFLILILQIQLNLVQWFGSTLNSVQASSSSICTIDLIQFSSLLFSSFQSVYGSLVQLISPQNSVQDSLVLDFSLVQLISFF